MFVLKVTLTSLKNYVLSTYSSTSESITAPRKSSLSQKQFEKHETQENTFPFIILPYVCAARLADILSDKDCTSNTHCVGAMKARLQIYTPNQLHLFLFRGDSFRSISCINHRQ